jgi:5-methylcytosine-specific restriction protein B
MAIGDLFVTLYDAKTIDGIGIIESEYFYDDKLGSYKHCRKVKWLVKDKNIPFYDLNKRRNLVQSTIYRLWHVDKNELLNIVSHENQDFIMTENKKRYVLIIDEINRGNISKIFGELITLIEDNKRLGKQEQVEVALPYSGELFGVPSNLYIIGTMNTADRSIALMDTALRRRFHFEEMMPDLSKLSKSNEDIVNANKDVADKNDLVVNGGKEMINIRLMLRKINQRIEYLYDRDHQIGHAYLIGISEMDELNDVMRNKIIPLLQEYFYDDWEKIRLILADNQTDNPDWQFVKADSVLSDINKLFGKNELDYIDDEKKVYSLNENAFNHKESYLKIYSEVKAEKHGEEIHDAQ